MGLSLEEFWRLTPKQYAKYIQAYERKQKEKQEEIEYQTKLTDSLNYILGRYISWSFNDPNHYPSEPFLSKNQKKEIKQQTDDEMERQARIYTMALGGEIKDARNDN